MGSLSFQVRIGIPGCLTIEVDAAQGIIQTQPFLNPQLNQPITDQLISKAWGQGWATPMTKRLIALGGNTKYQLLNFECPSLDLTDNAWGAQGSIDATSDPASIMAPIFGTSNFGRSFAVGDYILWDDPRIVSGVYQYEIDQITAVSGSNFTLLRRGNNASGAQFGSVKAAHTNIKFYRLIDKVFQVLWAGEWQVFKFEWDNMIVAAVSATTEGL